MQLNKKTLEQLRRIINADGTDDYRSGPKLVAFFNELGFNDTYESGFPSRWVYTDDKLDKINGTSELDKCIKNVFAVVNYIGRISELDDLIDSFNQYLAFDKWAVVRENDQIIFKKLDRVVVDAKKQKMTDICEEEFLKLTFDVDVDSLKLNNQVSNVIKTRIEEIERCIRSNAPLAAILLVGSVMEGVLLGTATAYPKLFNTSTSAPKDINTGNVRKFHDWTLNNFIDVAAENGILKQDVKKFSHVVREFRNYIHPYQQIAERFNPDKQTALICLQVLKAAIVQIGDYRNGGNH